MNHLYSIQVFNLFIKLNSYEIIIFTFFISLIFFSVTQQNFIIVIWFKFILDNFSSRVINLLVILWVSHKKKSVQRTITMSTHEFNSKKRENIKLNTSKEFYKDKIKMNVFIIQFYLYVHSNNEHFKNKNVTIFMINYLRENAFNWIRSHLKKIINIKIENQESNAKKMFINMSNFVKSLRRVFENVDAKKIAKRQFY